ncbi:hybrid sensor histidine kinase/response regulator [Cupriavidus oxalaticus]|uniref:histidine kinase n=1 Tax=Cupriavidus oxalaticus TaxID=96344 RepID=A0ABX7HL73_9BURK|nr:ATP-binding protein [Cupriavidus oxalaticus]QRQ84717.1 PAS domain-containing protein [Cupriavidus oxalaticus]QRQ91194.1 PAS domain-containing protein [Cupriavidus oxalaticus]WQD85747.1 ATP-binding protein [Cupriavidus oxalaticus]
MSEPQAAKGARAPHLAEAGDVLPGQAGEPVVEQVTEQYRRLLDAVEDVAVFETDAAGLIVAWPDAARRVFGHRAEDIAGRHFSCLHRADDVAAGLPQQWQQAAARAGSARDRGWRVRRDGSQLQAACVMHASAGGFVVACRDITVQEAASEHASLAESRLQLLADNLPGTAVCELDLDGTIRSWNVGAQAVTGYAAADAIGKPLALLYAGPDAAAGRDRAALEAARACGQWAGDERLARQDGAIVRCQTRMVLVRDAAGCPAGLIWTARDISDALRLELLESGNRRLQSFLAILGHELRNPLAPVRNAVEVIALTPDADARIRHCAAIIDRQLRQLERLVNDLLDVGRVTAGKMKMELTPTSYNDVVSNSLEAIRPVLDAAGQQLVAELPAVSPHVRADANRLGQVLLNLFSNATKYTPRGGTVSVRVQVEPARVVTIVSDTGRGLAPVALDRIFNLFSQEAEAGSRSGLGVGLALAKAVVEAHGGAIQADSAGPGQGSTFTVILPRAAAPRREAAAPAPAPGTPPRRRVLVVDDNADSADSMAELLNMLGHEARAAHGGHEALALAGSFRPDCVLLDLEMPDMSGYEVLLALRQTCAAQVRFLALTGRGTPEDQQRSKLAGFHAHLTKPLAIDALSRALADPATGASPPQSDR